MHSTEDTEWIRCQRDAITQVGKTIALGAFLPLLREMNAIAVIARNPNEDVRAAQEIAQVRLCEATTATLGAYIDFVVSAFAKGWAFDPQRLPVPSDEQLLAFAKDMGPVPEFRRTVVEKAIQRQFLPILGDINNGILLPNSAGISRWARLHGLL